jgi:hypothetical protein
VHGTNPAFIVVAVVGGRAIRANNATSFFRKSLWQPKRTSDSFAYIAASEWFERLDATMFYS